MSAGPVNPFASATTVLGAEHISLQSETIELGAKPIVRKSLVKYQLRSRARGSTTRITILDGHYVGVINKRRAEEREHTVDLRFVDPRPVGVRKVGWQWMYLALGLTAFALAAGIFVALTSPIARVWAVPAAIVLGTLTISSYLLCLYFTTESVLFLTTHGRARAIVITGGLGTTRAARRCALEVVKHINLARKQSKQTRQAYLRDEMREHQRLHEQGAITDEQFTDAQKRVLQAHD